MIKQLRAMHDAEPLIWAAWRACLTCWAFAAGLAIGSFLS